jgi:hypothetical protein
MRLAAGTAGRDHPGGRHQGEELWSGLSRFAAPWQRFPTVGEREGMMTCLRSERFIAEIEWTLCVAF